MTKRPGLSHVAADGRARMVDVSGKKPTRRVAVAEARIRARAETMELIRQKAIAKGDVESVVRLAAIGGAKRTADLIPLCHSLAIEHVDVEVSLEQTEAVIRATVTTTGKTGVEMEALTAATVGALAFYDMIKAVEKSAEIVSVRLLRKEGGKSGSYRR